MVIAFDFLCYIKPGFHTCVSRTHNSARCLTTYGHQCSQAIPAFAIKPCVLATKSHMLNFCEACASMCCDCDRWDFRSSEKRAKLKTKKCNNDFRKVVISNAIPDAFRDLHSFKYKRPRNKPNDGCLWKPAKCNSVHARKLLRFVASSKTFNGNQVLENPAVLPAL